MLELVKKENNNNWTSKKELMNNLQISSDTIEQIISDLSCRRPADTQNHIKKGGYHNSEVFYDDYLVNMITAFLKNYGWYEPLVNYTFTRPDVCKSSCPTNKKRTNLIEYRANDIITDPEKIGKRYGCVIVKFTNYRLEPCDKTYYTRIVINFQPDRIVMYDK